MTMKNTVRNLMALFLATGLSATLGACGLGPSEDEVKAIVEAEVAKAATKDEVGSLKQQMEEIERRITGLHGAGVEPTQPVGATSREEAAPATKPLYLAFVSRRSGETEIYVAPAVPNARAQRITDEPFKKGGPRWFPNGRRIVFFGRNLPGDPSSSDYAIWAVDVDGENLVRLAPGRWPDVSPDGQRIVFANELTIRTMNVDGSGIVQLTESDAGDGVPRWSPDGSQIVFLRSGNVWTMRADGTEQAPVFQGIGVAHPTWSPDGTMIAYVYLDTLNFTTADGQVHSEVPGPGRVQGGAIDWAPVGGKIAFSQGISGPSEIAQIGFESGGLEIVIAHPAEEWDPAYAPLSFAER